MLKNVDIKKINQLLKSSNLVLRNIYILIFLLIGYISILIINKLNIINIICVIIKLLSPLFIGIIIAWLLRPIVNYFYNKGMNKLGVVIILYIIILFIIYILLVTLIPIFFKELIEFVSKLPLLIDSITDSISFIKIDGFIDNMLTNISKKAMNIPLTCIGIIKDIGTVLVGFIIGFYMLIEDIKLDISIKKSSYELLLKINTILRNYVKGTLLAALIVFVASTILFYILHLPGALLNGFICGITNIIPFIGPYIGALIPSLIAFTKDTTFGIIVVVVILIIQTIEGNIIHPLIMKRSIKIHPVISIISLLIFGYFFGIVGMIIAVPLVAIIKELYFYLIKKYNKYKE